MEVRQSTAEESSAHLIRALGVSDLTWLYLVAIVNLNVVPVVAADGFRMMWLWAAAVLFFFLPQGVAVIELAERMPGEGGLYLWTKEAFGDFHGFMCGWCYWITNLFFVPTLLFYVTGITAYFGGAGLADNRPFFFALTMSLLWLTILANVCGLGVGKWVNNIGGIGALVIGVTLMALAGIVLAKHLRPLHWGDLALGNVTKLPLSSLGVVCLALVGLEIGPIMGDEIRDPRRTLPRSVLLGAILCALVYMGSTLSLLVAVPQSQMGVVQGLLQAADIMSAGIGLSWILFPLALLLLASIIGSTSAWVSGSARILFVCGIDQYLPKAFGRIHPRFGSPHVALVMFGLLASAIITMSFIGASVKEAYLTLLDLAVVLQMISYVYLFLTLFRKAVSDSTTRPFFNRQILRLSAVAGGGMTLLGLGMAFVPSRQIASVASFEWKMCLTLAFFLALAISLFYYYSRLKPQAQRAQE